MTLNCCSSAIGAAYVGAKAENFDLPLDYKKNTSILFTYDSTKKWFLIHIFFIAKQMCA